MPWIATTAFHSRSLTIYRRQTFDLVYLRAYISLITPEILPGSQHSFLPLYRIQLDFLCERVCFLKAAQIFFFLKKYCEREKSNMCTVYHFSGLWWQITVVISLRNGSLFSARSNYGSRRYILHGDETSCMYVHVTCMYVHVHMTRGLELGTSDLPSR
jgi:hypothetical protein